ncbi:hypothetical protein L208DRAFT_1247942 [Tricholoma matsutake]|nr:hypothetical protein L208DRAFT_1247942 [Tricholoma matsutake 945]
MSNNDAPNDVANYLTEDDAPITVPDSGETGEGGKVKMIVQLVKKCLGVKDIAAMRLSLPASLMEPIPNLEYWHYLDRPDIFAAINDSHDPFERMLAVLRFSFTKDLKFIHGKVCKPYNSVLGEHFRAHWDVSLVPNADDDTEIQTPYALAAARSSKYLDANSTVSETASVKSGKSSKSTRSGLSTLSKQGKSPSTAPTTPQPATTDVADQMSNLNLNGNGRPSRVVFLTEQISHHPPVSAYYASCPSRSLEMRGIDQISAKISGTTLKVYPGQFNQGIFVNITGGHGEGETYQITHPVASVNGILRGSFYVTVSDSVVVTCMAEKHGQKFRAISEYKEESWLGRARYLVEGVIHTIYEGETLHEEWTKIKHVPQSRIVAAFDGTWRGHIRWRRVGSGSYPHTTPSSASSPMPSHETLPRSSLTSASASKADISHADSDEYSTLMDLSTLRVIPKSVRPLEKQLPFESRKLWESVTDNLLKKEFSEATRAKIAIEQKQRDDAAERKKKGLEFVPQYFDKDISNGYAALTAAGLAAIEEELKEPLCS